MKQALEFSRLFIILTHSAVFSTSVLTQFPLEFTLDKNVANIVSSFYGLNFSVFFGFSIDKCATIKITNKMQC